MQESAHNIFTNMYVYTTTALMKIQNSSGLLRLFPSPSLSFWSPRVNICFHFHYQRLIS